MSKDTLSSDGKSLMQEEATLSSYSGEDRVIFLKEMREDLKNRPKSQVKFSSGFRGLDRLIDGFEGGELIAISGPTKAGKTSFCQALTVNFKKEGIESLWISFETTISQFLSQIPSDADFCLPRLLVPHNPQWLDDRIMEAKLKYNTRAVFIDHLHYLIDLEKGNRNLSVDIGSIVRRLKRAAIRHNIVIFLLCHATKALTPSGAIRELNAYDIRDSGMVTAEADSTIIIQRIIGKAGEENNKAMLKVCNHRRTGAYEQSMLLEKKSLLLTEVKYDGPGPKPEERNIWTQAGEDGNDSIPF